MDIHEIFNRIKEKKHEKKKLHGSFKEALQGSKPYQDILQELETLKAKKLQVENSIKLEFESELRRIDELKQHLLSDTQMLSDMALTSLMRGETVQITDENDQKYDPVFSVRFKKS
jgi:hypothetical protein